MPVASIEEIESKVGTDLGASDWITIDQERIDRFADVTEDWQFIHVDPEGAAATPLGGTIAHGFLSLSLLSRMGQDVFLVPPDRKMGLNYGFERIRFLSPVRAGRRVRGHFHLLSAQRRDAGQLQTIYRVTVEIEGEEKPALVADWIGLIFT